MLDDKLLENYIHNFFGHGNLDTNFWFISIEEGGGNTEKELQNRLTVWKKRGCKQVEDCKSFQRKILFIYRLKKILNKN